MSRQRNDKSTNTEFSNWLYECGFESTCVNNIDFLVVNYENKKFMLIEEKRHMSTLSFSQKSSFKILHGMCETGTFEDYIYCGFHKLVFQNTSPKDGRIWYDDIEIPEEKLLEIFTFNAADIYYQTLPTFKNL